VSVRASVPEGGAEGVLHSIGGNAGGFAFYAQDGKVTYGYNYLADQRSKAPGRPLSEHPMPSGGPGA
jgi:arylsulfatase